MLGVSTCLKVSLCRQLAPQMSAAATYAVMLAWACSSRRDSGNGVPDVLDRWAAKIFQSKVILAAAQAYYQTALPLATKAHMGVTLTPSEKLSVLRATECYLITATQEGLRSPPNLNDRVLIQGGQAAERLKGLFNQVQANDYVVSGSRKKACE